MIDGQISFNILTEHDLELYFDPKTELLLTFSHN